MAKKKHKGKPELLDTKRAQEAWTKLGVHELVTLLTHERIERVSAAGKHVKLSCPLHGESKPSFFITPEKGIGYCFGCHETYTNPVRLLADLRGESIGEVGAMLRKVYGVRVLSDKLLAKLEAQAHAASMKAKLMTFFAERLASSYASTDHEKDHLLWTDPAIAYLKSRGIGDQPGDPAPLVLCSRGILGIFPATVDVEHHFGTASEEFKFFRTYFASQVADYTCVGNLVFPYHDLPRSVSRFKHRRPIEDSCAVWIEGHDEDPEAHRGFYGLNYYSTYLHGSSGVELTLTAHAVEGEFDALTSIAEQVRTGSDDYMVLATGGGSAQSLDPLAALHVTCARLVQDNERSGIINARDLAERIRDARISVSVFSWPAQYDGIKDPDEAVLSCGYRQWSRDMADPDNFAPLAQWCCDRAVDEVTRLKIPDGDIKSRSRIATEWGGVLHDRQEQKAYCQQVAQVLELDAGLLERGIINIESEAEFIDALADALLRIYVVIGYRAGVLTLWHRAKRISVDVPIDDPRGQAKALAVHHGPVHDLVAGTVGDPAFIVGDGEEPSSFNVTMKAKKYVEYLNHAISKLAHGASAIGHVRTLRQGVHFEPASEAAYVINGSHVTLLTYAPDGTMIATPLEAPSASGAVFDVSGKAWFPGLKLEDLSADVPLAALFERVRAMVASGWTFRHGDTDVTYAAAVIMLLTIASALRSQPEVFITGEFSSGKSKFACGLIGGTDFPDINIVAHALAMSDYSEAGLRQRQEGSPLTVVLDEFEANGGDDKKTARVAAILELTRNLINESGVEKSVGTRDGKGHTYHLRFPFIACAIRPLGDAASRSRFVELETVKNPKHADPVGTLVAMYGADAIGGTRRDLVVGLLRHMPRVRQLEAEMRAALAPIISPTRLADALAPVAAMLALVREDAARRQQESNVPDGVEFAARFAATRAPALRQQDGAALSRRIFEAVLAAPVETGGYMDRQIETVRQVLAGANRTKAIARGLYYDDAGKHLVVAWAEVGQLLAATAWRGEDPGKLRQIAERDPRHLKDDGQVLAALKSLEDVMGLGHVPEQTSVYAIANLVVPEEVRKQKREAKEEAAKEKAAAEKAGAAASNGHATGTSAAPTDEMVA